MKRFMEEFRTFALRGNMMDMAVGIIIGSAFSGIVTSLSDNLITPLLNLFTTGQTYTLTQIGGFISAFLSFADQLLHHGLHPLLHAQSRQPADAHRQKTSRGDCQSQHAYVLTAAARSRQKPPAVRTAPQCWSRNKRKKGRRPFSILMNLHLQISEDEIIQVTIHDPLHIARLIAAAMILHQRIRMHDIRTDL